MTWLDRAPDLSGLLHDCARSLEHLRPAHLPRGTLMFRPGDAAQGFVVILQGRVEVFLTGPTGREILLYAVEPGQSCVQTTLGLMGGEHYTGEAIAATDVTVVVIPKPLFLRLMDDSAAFRSFVFTAFATRMQTMMHVLERVAFQRVESRLASTLLSMAEAGEVTATQADLATRIGSAREVVSRRLDQFARRGWVRTDRGRVRLLDTGALRRLAAADGAE
ncbi:Crp/Fnr family transcriptional regulator [Cereibacter sphaeroides]|uniref:Crp/Fnr family transcriptional regulator n=1 Tax=Cereibacter sphaeroides TaxID=1063 RepID=UPI001F1DB518|nr:Crp/Fnr family transcriptional regulator [Cereibacter sphaeroides]MCE6952905.1 Crp/Fnr family transcriptional regulator [Cereibacter sphaeroides]MCE6961997.1 Crp/Fnr family transcriptional regulator [Cereibacter sphaeroides]MCE6970772.1 Crp/Fnr family transcriptional regulator [Cereibacter sphaeroides]MCE6975632.1 Crp/Fnr family transcriptional regulator [Cereibacter sphaeroides]